MTQLQHAPPPARTLSPGIVAVVAVLAIAVTILLGMIIPSGVTLPSTGEGQVQSQVNPALVEAEREWQRQREQQGGFTDPLTQAGRDWERQRLQQSGSDSSTVIPAEDVFNANDN